MQQQHHQQIQWQRGAVFIFIACHSIVTVDCSHFPSAIFTLIEDLCSFAPAHLLSANVDRNVFFFLDSISYYDCGRWHGISGKQDDFETVANVRKSTIMEIKSTKFDQVLSDFSKRLRE